MYITICHNFLNCRSHVQQNKNIYLVSAKPEFVKKLSDSECKEGEAITLSTMVKGYPIPSIKW